MNLHGPLLLSKYTYLQLHTHTIIHYWILLDWKIHHLNFFRFRIRGGRCTALVGPPEHSPRHHSNQHRNWTIQPSQIFPSNLRKTTIPRLVTVIRPVQCSPYIQHHLYHLPILDISRQPVSTEMNHHVDQHHWPLTHSIFLRKQLPYFSIRVANSKRRITKIY